MRDASPGPIASTCATPSHLDVAERQALGAVGADVGPGLAPVGRAEDAGRPVVGEALAGDPGLSLAHGGQAAEVLVGVDDRLAPTVAERVRLPALEPPAAGRRHAARGRAGIVRRAGMRVTPSRRIRSPSTWRRPCPDPFATGRVLPPRRQRSVRNRVQHRGMSTPDHETGSRRSGSRPSTAPRPST